MANKEIKAFSFYKSYYDALEEIPESDKKEIIFAMIKYVFKGKIPKFDGVKKIIWTLIEPNLVKSMNKSHANSGAPLGNQNAKKGLENQGKINTTKKQSKNNQKTTNDIKIKSYSYSYINNSLSYININNNNNINNIYNLFIEYINLREKLKYNISETVVKRLINKLNEYGKSDENKIEIISKAINGQWKDFYELNENEKGAKDIYETI